MHFVIDKVFSVCQFPRFVLYVFMCSAGFSRLVLFKGRRQKETWSFLVVRFHAVRCKIKEAKVDFEKAPLSSSRNPLPEQVLSSVCRYTRCTSTIDRCSGSIDRTRESAQRSLQWLFRRWSTFSQTISGTFSWESFKRNYLVDAIFSQAVLALNYFSAVLIKEVAWG